MKQLQVRGFGGFSSLLVAAALTLVGCGSSSSGSNVDAWLGNWMEGGTQSTTCAGVPVTTQLDNTVIITAGSKAGTIETKDVHFGGTS